MNQGENDEVTRISRSPEASDSPPFWSAQQAPAVGASAATPRQQRPGWILPAIAAACAVILFASVLLFMHRGNTSSSSTATPTAHPSSATTPQSSPAASTASVAAPTTSTTTVTPTSATTAAFPPGSVTTCGGGPYHSDETPQQLDATVRVHSDDAHTLGCPFVARLVSYVRDQVAANPDIQNFSRPDHSERKTSIAYTDSCRRKNHLTTCDILGSSYGYVVYVQDSVG